MINLTPPPQAVPLLFEKRRTLKLIFKVEYKNLVLLMITLDLRKKRKIK